MITKLQAIISLVPGAEVTVYDNDRVVWIKPDVAPVTEEQIQAEYDRLVAQEPLVNCTTEAKSRIAKTDWSVLSDVGLVNVAEYVEYRAILRYLILNPVADPLWPVEPQPVWEAK